MNKLRLIILIFIACCNTTVAQETYPTPTAEETKEAQEFAAKFYNRYDETQDIEPLINEFFVKDFDSRVEFCWTTGECGGFARDFWGEHEDLVELKGQTIDFRRLYSFSINYFYLYFKIYNHIKFLQKDSHEVDYEKATISAIENSLKNRPELLRHGFFSDTDSELPKPTSLEGFRAQMVEAEELISELRKLESKFRTEAETKVSVSAIKLTDVDFTVSIIENSGLFFNYPVGTRMIDVWTKTDKDGFLPFKMDLIKENRKLKVVAIYPPID
jgi:hypothetical protein